MKHLRLALLPLMFFLAATPAGAAVDALTDVVPVGSPMVLYVSDVPNARSQWQGSAMANLWNDPQIKAFFAPLRDAMEIDRWDELVRDETGRGLDEIAAMLSGDMIAFMSDFELDITENAEDFDASIAILATVGDNAADVEELLLEQQAQDVEEAEDEIDDTKAEVGYETRRFRDVDLHIETVTEDDEVVFEAGWGVVDGVLAFGYPVESLETVVANILNGGVDDALASGDNFDTARPHLGDTTVWFFMDIEPWVPAVRSVVELGVAGAQQSSPIPLEPNTIMDALGLEAMQAVFLAFDQDKEAATFDFGLTYTENTGLIKLLAYGPGEAPRPDYIPTDSTTFSAATFDFAAAWSSIVEIVNGINPALMGMAAMQLQTVAHNAGVELDLKRDLLDNLTGELVTVQTVHGVEGDTLIDLEMAQDQVFAVGIRQREALENAIEGLKAIGGQGSELFSSRQFEGQTIFTLNMPQAEGQEPAGGISYVVTDNLMLLSVGTPATLEQCLLTMGERKSSVWKQPRVRRAVDVLPEGSTVIQFQDLAAMGDIIFPLVVAIDAVTSQESNGDFALCDPDAIPDGDVIGTYFSSAVTGAWKDDRSLVFRSWTLPADGQ